MYIQIEPQLIEQVFKKGYPVIRCIKYKRIRRKKKKNHNATRDVA